MFCFSLVCHSFSISLEGFLYLLCVVYLSGVRFKKFSVCLMIQTQHFVKTRSCKHASVAPMPPHACHVDKST